jgi:hypothetical protein
MEGIFEALLQFLFEFLLEVIGEILTELPSLLNHFAFKLNLPFEISFFDELIKLNLFD